MTVLVVAVPDVLGCQEQLNLIDLLLVQVALGLLLLDLLQPLLFVTGELQLLLIAPEYVGLGLRPCLGQHVVQVDYLQ